jgi:hypothetical protein
MNLRDGQIANSHREDVQKLAGQVILIELILQLKLTCGNIRHLLKR